MTKHKTPLIITHLRPHLDDTMAIWLLIKYYPYYQHANVRFVVYQAEALYRDVPVDAHRDVLYVGIGRGKFDEHKRKSRQTASTLVWAALKREGFAPKDRFARRGIEKMLDYVAKEDRGELHLEPLRDFTIDGLLHDGLGDLPKNPQQLSRAILRLGFQLLDLLFFTQTRRAILEAQFAKRRSFASPWGKVAAVTAPGSGLDTIAFQNGYVLLIQINPQTGRRQFRASSKSSVDLSQVHKKLLKVDAGASWYLHQSKRLLISDQSGSNKSISKLRLQQLIDLVRKK